MAPVSTQPLPSSMDAYSVDEKSTTQCQIHLGSEGQCSCAADSNPARHRACHQAMLRRLLLPVALLFLAIGTTLVISCVSDIDLYGLVNLGAGVSDSPLGKRQSSSGESSFTQDKLYLIVVFVGLFLVLIAGIMLSYWCCRGSFQNPLCCPCYLCACCGGLACLECIGCGLCAAGLEAA
ncbi:hypothetical protein HD554DRAFT_2115099 [Boletus coccyginus]|nr:hypothetical protein HD554DRAFT_2115099 [Boletus coccyginus]